jgi:hypothetical protein
MPCENVFYVGFSVMALHPIWGWCGVLGEEGNSVVIKSLPNEIKTGTDKANVGFASGLLGGDSPYVPRIYHIHFRDIRKREYCWISSNLPFGGPVFVEWF